MSAILEKLITADELFELPHDMNGNDYRSELNQGELKLMPPTGGEHGLVTADITIEIGVFVKANNLGRVFGAETGFILERDPDTVKGADVAFITHERLAQIERIERYVPFAPDIAVEVLSPSNSVLEIEEKIDLYFAAGAKLIWIINPRRKTVSVYSAPDKSKTLTEKDTLDGGDVLPGFTHELAKLFKIGKR